MQYFYHSDHLGSASFITDIGGNVVQHIQYLPFGELFVSQRNGEFDTRYKFTAKELDNETSYTYFGARYYDSDLSSWLSVDKLADKYPALSPYCYSADNPVMLKDPNGMWIGDYYDENGNWICNDGINDNRVYQANENGDITFGIGILKNTQFKYIGNVDEVKMSFTGNMLENSEKAQGKLNIIQIVGDKEFIKSSYNAVSGSRSLYSLENGEYESSNFRYRTNASMVKDGIGFSIDLIPTFKTGRSLLRIHPDGPPPGTEGCIGLTGNESQIRDFITNVKPIYDENKAIKVIVNINNNPNHNYPKSKQ